MSSVIIQSTIFDHQNGKEPTAGTAEESEGPNIFNPVTKHHDSVTFKKHNPLQLHIQPWLFQIPEDPPKK
jgi:hypothetical protein